MDEDRFWQIIDQVHQESGGAMERKCELLESELGKLSPEDLRDFIRHFDTLDSRAYTWSLWGAAYVMHGGCSDDSFSDFRATLISQGRAVFEAAIGEPETLAALEFENEDDICFEGFQYVKSTVAERRLGEIPPREVPFPSDPSGEEWDEDDLPALFPKLSARYGFD